MSGETFPLSALPVEPGEEWRILPTYPAYAVSNRGRVARIAPVSSGGTGKPGRLLSATGSGSGRVMLPNGPCGVQRLVAAAFPELPGPRPQARPSRVEVATIRALQGHFPAPAVAARFGVTGQVVWRIWRGQAYKDVPPIPEGEALACYGGFTLPAKVEQERRHPHTINITDSEAAVLEALGEGNVSAGVRRLIAERATDGT